MKLPGSSSKGKRLEKRVKPVSRASKKRGLFSSAPLWGKILVCCFAAVILTMAILALTLRSYVSLPNQDKDVTPPPDEPVELSPTPVGPDVSATVRPSDTVDVSPSPDSSPTPEKIMTARDGVYSFVLAGQKDGMTDTLMVALLDLKAMTFDVISIPRDTIIDAKMSIPKINSAYGAGGGGSKGMDKLRLEMRDILGFVPANFMLVSMNGFKELVDKLDGVDFDVPVDMYVENENIDLNAGYQHLDGEKALMLMRYRGYASSDFGRMQMQQKFLTAIGKKMLSWSSIPKIDDLASIFIKYTTSNLNTGQIAAVGEQLLRLNSENIRFHTLPTTAIHYTGGGGIPSEWYVTVNSAEALELINRTINPYTEDITEDMVKHIQLENPK